MTFETSLNPSIPRTLAVLALLALIPSTGDTAPNSLPASVRQALRANGVSPSEVSLLVQSLGTSTAASAPMLSHRADQQRNPASVMKLVTTAAALDVLGPQYRWRTRMVPLGTREGSSLRGTLVVRGAGDPKLVVERLEPMMRALREAGIERIEGDVALDRSAFEVPEVDPDAFDGEGQRPYNTRPDALLINFKAVVVYFTPDPAQGWAAVRVEPPLAGYSAPATVPLKPGACGNWRAALRADFSDPNRLGIAGHLPAQCQEMVWPMAYPDPASHSARAVAAMWAQVGGQLTGRVREASGEEVRAARAVSVQGAAAGVITHESLPMSVIVRDINKFSNNVMAQQTFLTLGLQRRAKSTLETARAAVGAWWRKAISPLAPNQEAPRLDNGSGLSRHERVSATGLAALLSHMHASPARDAWVESLPVVGFDGTAKGIEGTASGRAQIKTGSLRDVSALAGYVDTPGHGRAAFVAIYNGPSPDKGRRALEQVLHWAAQQ